MEYFEKIERGGCCNLRAPIFSKLEFFYEGFIADAALEQMLPDVEVNHRVILQG